MGSVSLQPIVTALQSAITPTDIVTLFTTGVTVALPLILIWFGARWVKSNEIAHLKVCEGKTKPCEYEKFANGETCKMAIPC